MEAMKQRLRTPLTTSNSTMKWYYPITLGIRTTACHVDYSSRRTYLKDSYIIFTALFQLDRDGGSVYVIVSGTLIFVDIPESTATDSVAPAF